MFLTCSTSLAPAGFAATPNRTTPPSQFLSKHIIFSAGGSTAVFRRLDLPDQPPYTFQGTGPGEGTASESDSHDPSMDPYRCSADVRFGGLWRIEVYPTRATLDAALTVLPGMIALAVGLSAFFLLGARVVGMRGKRHVSARAWVLSWLRAAILRTVEVISRPHLRP